MISLEKNFLLCLNISNLILLNYNVLVETLHRVLFTIFLIHNKENFTEGALIDDLLNSKIRKVRHVWHFSLIVNSATPNANRLGLVHLTLFID